MKVFLLGAAAGAALILLCAFGFDGARSRPSHYEMHNGPASFPFTFVFDPRTGRVWSYWFNTTTRQGWMNEVTYSDPPDELKAKILREIPKLDLKPAR